MLALLAPASHTFMHVFIMYFCLKLQYVLLFKKYIIFTYLLKLSPWMRHMICNKINFFLPELLLPSEYTALGQK